MAKETLSAGEARRIALAAQGFAPRLGAGARDTSRRALVAEIERLGVLQIDSVNALVRSHYLPLFSRLGPYPREVLDDLAYAAPRARTRRRLFEYWGHEASLLPLDAFPLLRWRMDRAARGLGMWKHVALLARDKPELVRHVEQEVRDRGPLAASDLSDEPKARGPWWGWSEHKRALEYLFWSGRITTAARRNFERLYDLVERVIPETFRDAPPQDEESQQRELLLRASRALGVATAKDLCDYFRLPILAGRARLGELAEEGLLERVGVAGWKQPAFLAPGAAVPRAIDAAALLSPFDSLIWSRDRTERLFGFRFRLEIYTPAHLRVHGYYVLPFLLGDTLVARVDLKSDRAAGTLVVKGLHLEAMARRATVVVALRDALESLADWLGLGTVDARALRRPSGGAAAAVRRS
jgi:uncharacterized protein YcaQ